MIKPSLFIGSSTEGLDFARAVRSVLTQDAEITVWNEGFFGPGGTFIEKLITSLPRFDFAVLVLTPDDLVNSRQLEVFGPRDNVLFELGLFMGRLGRSRTFVLHQSKSRVKIPSDLAGVITVTYDWPRADGSHKSAVGSASDSIREVIRDLGVSETKMNSEINAIKSLQSSHETRLTRQQAEIRSLQVALQGIVTHYEMDKLEGLAKEEAFLCYYSNDLYNELKRLRAMGLVNNHEGVGLTTLRNKYNNTDRKFDLKRYFYITSKGHEYRQLREKLLEDKPDA